MDSVMMKDSKGHEDEMIVTVDRKSNSIGMQELIFSSSHSLDDEKEQFNKEQTTYEQFMLLGETLKNETSGMYQVIELLKLGIDSLKNKTSDILLFNDKEYQLRSQWQQKAYKEVMELNLPAEQMDIINEYIAKRDEADFDRHTLYYMAGMLDNYEILKLFNLTNE